MVDLSTLGVAICLPIALIFSIIGLLHARVIFKDDSIVFYLTAKNSVGVRELALSFFASLSGAWMLFVPSQIVVDADKGSGWLGLLICCVFSVLSFILIVWFGNLIRERFPEVLSIGHYAGLRFGYTAQIFITCVSFGNMVLGN